MSEGVNNRGSLEEVLARDHSETKRTPESVSRVGGTGLGYKLAAAGLGILSFIAPMVTGSEAYAGKKEPTPAADVNSGKSKAMLREIGLAVKKGMTEVGMPGRKSALSVPHIVGDNPDTMMDIMKGEIPPELMDELGPAEKDLLVRFYAGSAAAGSNVALEGSAPETTYDMGDYKLRIYQANLPSRKTRENAEEVAGFRFSEVPSVDTSGEIPVVNLGRAYLPDLDMFVGLGKKNATKLLNKKNAYTGVGKGDYTPGDTEGAVGKIANLTGSQLEKVGVPFDRDALVDTLKSDVSGWNPNVTPDASAAYAASAGGGS